MVRNLEVLTVVFALCGGPSSFAQETERKDGSKPAAAQKAKTSGKKAAKAMSVQAKEKLKNNIRRLLQASKLEQAGGLIKMAIRLGKANADNSDLLAYGYWAQAALAGYQARTTDNAEEKAASKKSCLKFIDQAIETGWRNPFSFEYAALIDEEIRNSAEFRERIDRLIAEFASHREEDFRAKLKTGLAAAKPFTLPATVTNSDALSALLRDKPVVLVISRIYHDGFRKIAPVVATLDEEFRDSVPTLILFYQSFPASPREQKLTEKYYQSFGLSAPFSFVTRKEIKPLDLTIFPVVLFLDGEGRLVLRQDGLLEARFLERFLRIAYSELNTTGKETPAEKTTPSPEKEEAKEEKLEESKKGDA